MIYNRYSDYSIPVAGSVDAAYTKKENPNHDKCRDFY